MLFIHLDFFGVFYGWKSLKQTRFHLFVGCWIKQKLLIRFPLKLEWRMSFSPD